MNFTPIHDRLLVKLVEEDSLASRLSVVGLVAPNLEEEKVCGTMIQFDDCAHTGEVIAVGPGRWVACSDCGKRSRRPMSVKVGDVIRFGRFADFGRDGLLVIQEDDVLGIMTTEEANYAEACH